MKCCMFQTSHVNQEGMCICCTLRVFNCIALTTHFLEPLRDETMIFAGVRAGGDLAKIERDYHCTEVMNI